MLLSWKRDFSPLHQ